MNARAKILILALVQAGTMLAWAGYHERLWQTAPTFRIALNPIDPYDVLRGRYFILNPRGTAIGPERPSEDSLLSAAAYKAFLGSETSYTGKAQIGFCSSGAIRKICAIARPDAPLPAPTGALWTTGEVNLWRDPKKQFTGSIDLGLDRFFLPNRARLPAPENVPGWEIEVVHRPGLPLLPKRLWFGGKPVVFL
ncbi:MAG TPA: hypothetical protein VN851_17385 [Thermoanaerobaculia bacterium]|nr:hypothetical protein [Thermoanaerobaculia bacterium]